MEFVYDGSHLIQNEIDEEKIFSYTNGVSLWMIFNNIENTRKCLIKLNDEVIAEFKKVTEGEAFVQGMIMYAERQGEFFVKVDKQPLVVQDSELQAKFVKLRNEMAKLKNEKEKAQALAGKLIKGIMKDKAENTEHKIRGILEKHVQEI